MQIGIVVVDPPYLSPSVELALSFAQTAVSSGHEVNRVFFHKDAVYLGNSHLDVPTDEVNLQTEWTKFAVQNDVPLVLCVTSAQRRGIVSANIADGFEIAGLGQLIETMFESDRVVTF